VVGGTKTSEEPAQGEKEKEKERKERGKERRGVENGKAPGCPSDDTPCQSPPPSKKNVKRGCAMAKKNTCAAVFVVGGSVSNRAAAGSGRVIPGRGYIRDTAI
jgi:hypothetical protein